MKEILILFSAFIIQGFICHCMGQQKPDPRLFIKDTTPVEQMEYRLSKSEFLTYYAIDDTSRALINMFFRKRMNGKYSYCLAPVGGVVLTGVFFNAAGQAQKNTGKEASAGGYLLAGLLTGLSCVVILPIDGLINLFTHSRKKLLYVLVARERGYHIPPTYIQELKSKDFEKN